MIVAVVKCFENEKELITYIAYFDNIKARHTDLIMVCRYPKEVLYSA